MTPEGLRYTKDHEWAKKDGDLVTVGITHYAQDQLGDVVFVELPAVGKTLAAGDTFGVVEAVKTVSDLYAPIGGTIAEVNPALAAEPGLVNQSPYEGGWMIRIQPADPAEVDSLLDAKAYSSLLETH
ncbi:MAG: glycine cleavage system protein GcvH [Candidatus Eisenbacteria bacterium]